MINLRNVLNMLVLILLVSVGPRICAVAEDSGADSGSGDTLVTSKLEAGDSGTVADDAQTTKPLLRDPFWPLGFSPKAPEKKEEEQVKKKEVDQAKLQEQRWKEALSKINVKGIFKRGPEYVAMINNAVVKEGQVLQVRVKKTVFKIKVVSIDMKKGVKLERVRD